MRRLLSERVASVFLLILAPFVAPLPGGVLAAQSSVETNGALELVLPLGARVVGVGEAAVAARFGTEGLWWNPSSIARETQRQVSLHYAQAFTAPNDLVLGALVPVRQVGVAALSGRLVDYGPQELTDPTSSFGTLYPRATIYVATFAAPFGERLSAGLSYKLYQFRYDCTGACGNVPKLAPTTSALDFGAQYVSPKLPVSFGVAVRNIGVALQVRDEPQSDELPTRVEIGAAYVPTIGQLGKDAEVTVMGDVVARLRGGGTPGLRLGGDLGFQKKYHVRAGYMLYEPSVGTHGFTFGLGASTGRLQLDVARIVGGPAGGQPPTYLSLSYSW